MGYLSNISTEQSTPQLGNEVVYIIKQNAKLECVDLIILAHKNYIADNEKVFSNEETIITAGIFKHLDILIETNQHYITVAPERYEYTDEIKNGIVNPKKSKRLDLYFEHLNLKPYSKTKFSVEAKLLAEKTVNKKSLNHWVSEYVDNPGMGKFINKDYEHEGFMLGYILNGNTNTIITSINAKIANTYSIKETIKEVNEHNVSNYIIDSVTKELYHIFLDFNGVE